MTILLRTLIYFSLSLVKCSLLHIYGSTNSGELLANFSNSRLCNYSLNALPQGSKANFKFLNLDFRTGILRLASIPDCRTVQESPLLCSVQAINKDTHSLITLETIVIYIHGECSEELTRNLQRFTVISRDAKIGTKVFLLKDLFNLQSSINPRFLRLVNREARQDFSIDSTTGHLLLRKSLIGKQQRVYKIIVEFPVKSLLKIHQNDPVIKKANLRLYIDDRRTLTRKLRRVKRRVRNNPPQFGSSYTQANVLEDCPIGTTVTTVSASDVDSGSNGVVRYSMYASQNLRSQAFFNLNAATGVIKTTRKLDREKMDRHYFRVTAKDQGDPALESTMDLTIIVDDVNDNTPVFENSFYTTSIPENKFVGDTVLEVRARDEDAGKNGEIVYSIENSGGVNSAFVVDPRTGVITVDHELDREKVASYNLIVKAQDQGSPPKSAMVNVKITLLDINDCTPQFSKKVYKATVSEDVRPRTLVETIVAKDCDLGSNGEVFYEIVSGNDQNLFSINKINGEVRVQGKLDYERMPVFNLWINAQDKGATFLVNQTVLEITLKDVNDNPPEFVTPHFQVAVSEGVKSGQVFTRVQAIDRDDGINKMITYSLMRTDIPFKINPQNGDISTSRNLDREKVSKYNFGVKATDKGKPPLEGTAQMTITVLDVNDNPPKFGRSTYKTSISEKAKWGTTVLQVTARDPDSGPTNIVYSIDSSYQQRCFRINAQGLITLSCTLNYKITKSYVFEIRASDSMLDSTAVVYVNVTDANTNAPVFGSQSYRGKVREDVKVGTSVLKVHATDDDTGSNAKISYSFEKPVSDFSIDSTSGIIRTSATLDRETKATYQFAVTATDHGKPPLKKKAYVSIRVRDVNDNPPIFVKSEYSATVKEDIRPGERVVQVRARDKDNGKNQQITYSFARNGNGGGAFQIDATQGVIRSLKQLDRETKPTYDLTVLATDRGRPPQQSSVKVKVTLLDVIDSPPKFERSKYEGRINEDAPSGTSVITVKAKSQDLSPDTGMIYSIQSGNSPKAFTIDRTKGKISTSMALDYETKSVYHLRVRATLTPYFAETIVKIYLNDVNDNPPVLENFYMSINVKEDVVPPEAKFRIPAYDPDVSDKLEFDIIGGNERQWVTLNKTTGELSVSPTLVNTVNGADIQIQVSDGAKQSTAKGSIMVTSITSEMLMHSLRIEIDDMTVKEFLDLAYDKLIGSIAKRLGATMDQVLLFDIKTRVIKSTTITEYDRTQLTIWLVVRKKSGNNLYRGFFQSFYVRDIIYLHREKIAEEAGVKLLPLPDDLCSKKPCNYLSTMRKDCNTFIKFIGNPVVLSSLKVVFRTVPVEMSHNCTCPVDYRGASCDTHLNLCYSNPCKNNGKCISIEKGYACLCMQGRSGKNCEINVTNHSCPPKRKQKLRHNQLAMNPCRNDGSCLDNGVGGFMCGCKEKPKVDTSFCELTTRSFVDGDFAAFPALKQKWGFNIKLDFATLQSEAVLLYNGRYNNRDDFVAIEITGGQVQLTISAGNNVASAVTDIEGGVNDGAWHTITAVLKNQTSIVMLDKCDMGIAVQFGNQEGSFSCAASKRLDIKRTDRSVELSGPLFLGGLPNTQYKFPISNKHYKGCLKNVYIDYKLLDLAQYELLKGTKPYCQAKKDYCSQPPCKRGTCSNTFDTYFCKCPDGYGGKNCQNVVKNTVRFTGNSVLIKAFRTSAIGLPWTQSLQLRTRKSSGYVMETRFRSENGILEIIDGRLSYHYGKYVNITLPELKVDNGAWHHVEIKWLKELVKLTVDYVYMASSKYSGAQLEFTSEVLVGAKKDKSSSKMVVTKGFTGCIAGILIDGQQLDIKDATKHNILDGCKMPTHCQSNPCSGGSTCQEGWDSYTCICRAGYVGKQCQDVCRLKPCHHGSCVKTSSSAKGFKCLCRKQFTGEYCETRMETPCPNKFFSASNIGLCGPCNCPLGNNYSPVCNKTTGECYCNPNHYRRIEGIGLSKQCYKCNCESIGSRGQQCDVNGGQCPCVKGKTSGAPVVGRRCDQCEDKQSEIIKLKGCVVINTSCPRSMAEEIWWKRGTFNKMAKQKCPFGASGTATRFCDRDKGWQKPNLVDCVSNSFLSLRRTLKKLDNKELEWTPEIAMRMARDLDLSITLATRLYPKDIEIALKTITVLFNYESQQNASTLISAKNHQFAQILFQSASMLFNADNKDVWKVVQRNSAGTADLMLKMENFSGTLANNLAHLKRGRYRRNTGSIIPPYTIITPNILMELDPLMMKNFEGTLFPPRQTAFAPYSSDWSVVTTKVALPKTIFKSEGHKVLERNAAVGYMVIRNIGDLLPKSFDAKISDSRYKVEVNSDVVSVRLPGMENVRLKDPIHITFYNRHVNRSEYICVFWNYSVPNTRGGGWSTNGCRRVAVNWTHTTCACDHMTSFAVLSDLNLEYPPEVAFAMRIVTYVGIAVCIAILLVAFISFMCLRGLKKSNANDIHKNLIASIVLAEVVFLVGINRTEDETACRLIAILLHYFFSTVFTWMLVESVHMYRRLSEKRNVDTGRMNFYYFLGWGCPAIVVGISAGLTTDGYGSKHFCWMSTDGTLIWTFTIPVMIVVAINTVVFLMAVYMSLSRSKKKRKRRHSYSPHGHDELGLKAGLRASAILLPLLGVTLVFAILMVNKDIEMFHYCFAGLTCFQGLFIFLFYCLFDQKVRREFKNAYIRWKTGDKSFGIPKPVQHFKRSYHPGEMTAVRSPYHYDEDDGGNTSTSEPSSSMPSSSAATSRPTSAAFSTGMSIPEDSSVRSAGDGLTGTDVELEEFLPKPKAKYYPDNPELEKARKMWETPEKSEHSTTNPESSSDDENRNPSPVILSESSESSGDEQIPNGEEKTPEKSNKHKAAPFYASDGPMHSTPMDTTPEEETEKKKRKTSLDDSDSSETDEEDKALERGLKDGPKFTSIPEIIPDVIPSGSAATTSDTPSEAPIKKPLKSALKKPRSSHNTEPCPASPLLNTNEEPNEATSEKSPDSSAADSRSRSKSREHKDKKRKGRKHRQGGRDKKAFVKFGNRGSVMSEPSEFI